MGIVARRILSRAGRPFRRQRNADPSQEIKQPGKFGRLLGHRPPFRNVDTVRREMRSIGIVTIGVERFVVNTDGARLLAEMSPARYEVMKRLLNDVVGPLGMGFELLLPERDSLERAELESLSEEGFDRLVDLVRERAIVKGATAISVTPILTWVHLARIGN